MSNDHNAQDPLQSLWGNMGFSLPGMVTPTLDTDELEKRITDLKAVEGWLRMNLSMLQMTIQGMEMQRATLNAVKAMGQMGKAAPAPAEEEAPDPDMGAAAEAAAGAAANAFSQAAMWPWNVMNQMQEHLQQQEAAGGDTPPAAAPDATAQAAAKASTGKAAPKRPRPAKKNT